MDQSTGTKPPTNLDEYLKAVGQDDWPVPLDTSAYSMQVSSDRIIDKNLIATKLLQAAPLSLAGFGALKKSIEDFDSEVNSLGDYFIQEKETVSSELQEKRVFFAPPKTFLTEIAQSDIVHRLAGAGSNKKADGKAGEEFSINEENERNQNVLKAVFPGMKPDAPTDLPNWIELPGLVEKSAQTIKVPGNLKSIWRQIYLSQASIVLIQDGFWWIFLDYFKEQEDDVVMAKDNLFDRMADTYVTLFFSIDTTVRDKFFKDYTTIISQAIFLAFAEAFTDSQHLYNNEFKAYLADTVSLWLQGVRAVPGVYTNWAANTMLKAEKVEAERKQREANMVFDPATLDAALTKLPPVKTDSVLTFRKLVRYATTVSSVLAPSPSKPIKSAKKVKESLVLGQTDKMERVKFRLEGNSQLMDHHMRMHGIAKVRAGPLAVRSQQLPSEQQTTQTYADVISESKKAMKTLNKHLNDLEKQTQHEINEMRRQFVSDRKKILEGKAKSDVKTIDPAKAAAMEVRELMKKAITIDENPQEAANDNDEPTF